MALDVFISYSPKDRALCDELRTHLSNLQRQGQISAWYDGNIAPGANQKAAIQANLNKAHLILLLISADYLESDFCYSIEMQQALARHQANLARVIPIILRPTDWEESPFAHLKELPTNGKSVTEWPSHDSAFKHVVKGLRGVVEEWQARTPLNLLERLDDIFAGLRPTTKGMYRRDIAAYDLFAKAEGLDFYKPETLDTWRDQMERYTRKSPNTINRMLAAVRSLFRKAARLKMVDRGVAAEFANVPRVKEKALKERLKRHARTRISQEDMRRLCESPNVKTLVGIRDRALLATLASSGTKASELASLTKSQILAKDGGYQLSVRGNTDSDYRDAPLSPEAKKLIDQWLAARPITSKYIFTSFAGRGNRPLDKPITESGLWKVIDKYAEHCGLKVKPHDFRRFVGTQLAATDLHKAQKALGLKKFADIVRDYPPDDLPVGITDNLY